MCLINYSDYCESGWICVIRSAENTLAVEPLYQTSENGPRSVWWKDDLRLAKEVQGFERFELWGRKRLSDTSTLETLELETLSR